MKLLEHILKSPENLKVGEQIAETDIEKSREIQGWRTKFDKFRRI